jgi:hypothetical protein
MRAASRLLKSSPARCCEVPVEGITQGDTISGFADTLVPSSPPIREGFTEGLHLTIDLFQQDTGPGLGDGFILF